jgi:transposase
MEKNEGSCSVLRSLNLDNIEEVVSEAYHQEGAGRPPRKPIGIFKALIVKRVKQIPSDRELYRRLWYDQDLREVCDIEAEQKPEGSGFLSGRWGGDSFSSKSAARSERIAASGQVL